MRRVRTPKVGTIEWFAAALFNEQKLYTWHDVAPWVRQIYRKLAREIRDIEIAEKSKRNRGN